MRMEGGPDDWAQWSSPVIKKKLNCTQPPLAEATTLLCPHHKGAGAPHPIPSHIYIYIRYIYTAHRNRGIPIAEYSNRGIYHVEPKSNLCAKGDFAP